MILKGRKKSKPSSKNRNKIFVPVVFAFLLILIGVLAILDQQRENEQKSPTIQEKNGQIFVSYYEAQKFGQKVILKVLRNAEKSDNISSVRYYLGKFFEMIKDEHLEVYFVEVYALKDYEAYALSDYNFSTHKFAIVLAIPKLIELRNKISPSNFQDFLIFAISHEMIHIVNKKIFMKSEDKTLTNLAANEAFAWSVTCTDIIQPMIQKNRYVHPAPYQIFKKYNEISQNNPDNPLWLEWIKQYVIPQDLVLPP